MAVLDPALNCARRYAQEGGGFLDCEQRRVWGSDGLARGPYAFVSFIDPGRKGVIGPVAKLQPACALAGFRRLSGAIGRIGHTATYPPAMLFAAERNCPKIR